MHILDDLRPAGQSVIVTDGEAPDLLAPADFAVAHDPGVCLATGVSLGTAFAEDNCGVVDIFNDAPDFFGLGDTEVTWYALDAEGNVMTATQVVTVTNAAPMADAGADIVVECTSPAGRVVTLDAAGSHDADDPLASLSFKWSAVGISFDDDTSLTPSATFPLGATTVSLQVTDPCGAIDAFDVIVVVEDTTAPQIQAAIVDQPVLWPANQKMIPITLVLLVSDTCVNPGDLMLFCEVTSNEPDDALGDGAFSGDVDGDDGFTSPVSVSLSYSSTLGVWGGVLYLRAERDGGSDGRKYSIFCQAIDSSGNMTTATVCVTVPHSQKGGKK